MEKWELARYLIDAKKSIDAILYLSLYAEKVLKIDIRRTVNGQGAVFILMSALSWTSVSQKRKRKSARTF